MPNGEQGPFPEQSPWSRGRKGGGSLLTRSPGGGAERVLLLLLIPSPCDAFSRVSLQGVRDSLESHSSDLQPGLQE